MDLLNGLDLFSGIGGISLALSEWVRPIAYCEIDTYCQGVLLSRMADGIIENSPIWDNVTTFDGRNCNSIIDIIYGGFPCQDISVAGKGKGLEGERSGLFFEIVRLSREIKPRFIFLENVPAITTRGGAEVVRQITALGYDCRWCIISAASVGALHKRERWFLLANSTSKESNRHSFRKKETYSLPAQCNIDGNTDSQPGQQTNSSTKPEQDEGRTRGGSTGQHWPFESREHWQEIVGGVCRITDGVQFHVDRLKSLGNSVVPQQAKEAFKILMGIKND